MNQSKFHYSGRPSWLNQMGSFSSMLILILMPFFIQDMALILIAINVLIAFLIMLTIIYNRCAWKFTIGNGNVQSQHGIISRDEKIIRIRDIRNIKLKQTTIQRVFGVGDVEFNTAGSSGSRVTFYGIASPAVLKDQINHAKRKKGRLA